MSKGNEGFVILMIIAGLIVLNNLMSYKKEYKEKDKDFNSKSSWIYTNSIIFGGVILVIMLVIWLLS